MRFVQRGADPTRQHLAVAPALDVARVMRDRAVHILDRVGGSQRASKRLCTWGRATTGRISRNLASGLFRCHECGTAYIAHQMSHGSGRKRNIRGYYECSWNNQRGSTVCSNSLRIPMRELHDRLLDYIERDVLTPARAEKALRKAEADVKRLTSEKDNLIAVQAHLSDPKAVAEQINDRIQQIGRPKIELDSLPGNHATKLAEKVARMAARLSQFRDLMQDRKNISLDHQVLAQRLGLTSRPVKIGKALDRKTS